MRIFNLLLILSLMGTTQVQAQKYAYCNGGNLVEALARKESTDQQLESFQAPLLKKGQDMLDALKENERKLYADIEKGLLSQIAIQERQQLLIAETEKITEYEKEVANKIGTKRQELLEPLLKKVQEAIDGVAKSSGYLMVFDESLFNAILYAEPSHNITDQVRAKLGL